MRKSVVAFVMLSSLLLSVGPAMSTTYTVNDGLTDVGGLDELIASTLLPNSGDATELEWVQSVLGSDWFISDKILSEDQSSWIWLQTDDQDVFAFDLGGEPEYFLLKIGKGDDKLTHFIFKNSDSLFWAVVDLSESFEGLTIDITRISHADIIVNPEPGTLLLMGGGLLGSAFFARRRKKSL